ncbi:MAG: DUF3786 domain-containing protein [Desulfobulbaceae bacterium]
MAPEKNPLEIYKLLPRTNCGQCYLPSCLAFAAAVVSGSRKPGDCPYLPANAVPQALRPKSDREPYTMMREEHLVGLQEQAAAIELAPGASRLGARMAGEKLAVTCLGKDFFIDPRGRVTSECHTHCGLTIPLLSYVLCSKGDDNTGRWVPFRELQGGAAMSPLFGQRGEKRLQRLADRNPELFDDLVTIFSGVEEKNMFSADISVVLRPLPKVPVLICYWKPEDDLASKLNIFFDSTADRHLLIESIFELTVGMVMMFEKIAQRHQ